jgi:hypothetical protein
MASMGESDTGARRVWSREEVELLKRLLFAHTPVSEIARRLGRTEGAVRTRASQIGISLRALKRTSRSDGISGVKNLS